MSLKAKLTVIFLCTVNCFFLPSGVEAQGTSVKDKTLNEKTELFVCKDPKLGITLACNPKWLLETKKNVLFVIISSDPIVTLTIAKSEDPAISLKQLVRPAVQEIGQYEDGFTMAEVKIDNTQAIKVEGYPKDQPDTHLFDHYVIHDLALYSILFSVSPKEHWKNYEQIVYKIIDGIKFE